MIESMEEVQGAGEEEDGAGKDCVLQFTAPLTLQLETSLPGCDRQLVVNKDLLLRMEERERWLGQPQQAEKPICPMLPQLPSILGAAHMQLCPCHICYGAIMSYLLCLQASCTHVSTCYHIGLGAQNTEQDQT